MVQKYIDKLTINTAGFYETVDAVVVLVEMMGVIIIVTRWLTSQRLWW